MGKSKDDRPREMPAGGMRKLLGEADKILYPANRTEVYTGRIGG